MTDDAHLDEALKRADAMLASSLRQEDAQRQAKSRRAQWIAGIFASFIVGIAIGALGMALLRPAQPAPQNSVIPPGLTAATQADPPTTGKCEVKWGNTWFRARIIDREDDIFLVNYDRGGTNEWVTQNRIRAIGSERDPIGYARPTPYGKKPERDTTKPSTGVVE